MIRQYYNPIQVVVATIAFGMGIDKLNVRRIIHYGWPQVCTGLSVSAKCYWKLLFIFSELVIMLRKYSCNCWFSEASINSLQSCFDNLHDSCLSKLCLAIISSSVL